MARIIWGDVGARTYETGLDRGVLYVGDDAGVPWEGLTGVSETPTGGAATAYYVDGEKYLNQASREEFAGTLTAYTYPEAFEVCDGAVAIRSGLRITQQRRSSFGLSYRTMAGNDQSSDLDYKIHILYNVLAGPSPRPHKSMNATADIDDFSWALTTTAPPVGGYLRSPHLILSSTELDPLVLSGLEDILYGSDSSVARLPFLDELTDLIDTGNTLTVVDNGDGTYSVTAPMYALSLLDPETFQLTWSTANPVDAETFTISSP